MTGVQTMTMDPALVRQLREDAGLTQAALAEACGISLAAVEKMEGGRAVNPRLSTLRALAAALGTTVAVLVGDQAPRRRRRRKGG